MIKRYSRQVMAQFFTDVAQWDSARAVELAATQARAQLGQVPAGDLEVVLARTPIITEDIVDQISLRERTTDHDVAAFVDVLQRHINDPASRWIHFGLTSADVTDTALCLRLAHATDRLIGGAEEFSHVLCERAREFAHTPTAGRTHGQHAEVITFGVRLANWAQMLERAIQTLKVARDGIAVGKLSGACGTYSNIDPRVEQIVCEHLGLKPIMATQVIPRDLHAKLLTAVAELGNCLGHIFFNERIMAMTEVGEVEEGRRAGQKGSSAMPHKRNPIKGEQLCGLARVLRGYAQIACENVELLFERDISHSAPERIIFPDSLILADYMVSTAVKVTGALVVKPERMRLNIDRTQGLMFTQTALTELINRGMARDDAYRLVQSLAYQALDEQRHLRELLAESEEAGFSNGDLARIFDEQQMLGRVDLVLDQLPA